MNEESNTTTIIVVLVVLGLLVIGTIFLTRFIVRRISRAFSRQPSRQRAGRRERKEKKGSPKDAPGSAFKEPTLNPKTSAREHTAPKTQRPEAPVARTAPPKSQTPEPSAVVRLSSAELHPQEASSPPKEPTPKTTRQTRTKRRVGSGWVPKDGSAYVGGREIGGMVYVGPGPPAGFAGEPDNAFIDPSKSVARHGGYYEGQGLHHWPSYSTIAPRSRATYLDWLSGDRADSRYNVGYVFLYFYGLERRVFVDKTNPQERADIVAEVRRLLEIYGDSHSIRRYLGSFLDTTSLLESSNDPKPVFEHDGYEVPANVSLALGRLAARGAPLTSDWLLSWFLSHPETRLRAPARRAFSEFRAYFQYLFDQECPDGLKIREVAPVRRTA